MRNEELFDEEMMDEELLKILNGRKSLRNRKNTDFTEVEHLYFEEELMIW